MKFSENGTISVVLAWLMALFAISPLFAQVPTCTQLSVPQNGESEVSVFTDFEWDPAPTATGYVISIGTSIGGRDILNNENVGNVTEYSLDGILPPFETIHVSIIPYNDQGLNGSCSEVVFTTRQVDPPNCTEIINPSDGDALVSVTANITWIRDFRATGYRMSISEGDVNGIVVWRDEDVGNGTNIKPPDFKPRTRYFVTLVPYNTGGSATGCQPISFTTGDGPQPLDCTELRTPLDGTQNVGRNPSLEWGSVDGADGYILSVGTTPRGTDIVDNLDVGNTTDFNFASQLPANTRVYVLVVPYTGNVRAAACGLDSFTTASFSQELVDELVPNFFTPNNDGFNDVWLVNNPDELTIEDISVFNRFGMLITQLLPNQGWDGTFNGQNLPSDSYWYSITLSNGEAIKGYFALKR